MGYQEEKAAQNKELKAQVESGRIAEVLYEFFKSHPEIVSCDANRSIIREFFDDSEKITASNLEDALGHTSLYNMLAKQSPDDEREKLVDYVIENRQMSPDTSKHERARLLNQKLTTIETVRTIAENIQRKRELSQLPKQELQALARGPERQKFHEIPALFRTRSMMISLASEQTEDFRNLVRRCGHSAVNRILQQTDDEEREAAR